MAMQIVAVPLYDRDMAVNAYVFRYQTGNPLFSMTQTTSYYDGAGRSQVLDTLDMLGLEAFTVGKQIFVPITYLNLLSGIDSQCKQPADKVIFLFEEAPPPEEPYISIIARLASQGYRFAISYLYNPEAYGPILQYCNYYFLSQRPEHAENSLRVLGYLKRNYREIVPIATHVRSEAMMRKLTGTGYVLYESRFFSAPITRGDTQVSPLKANSIRLLNMVQDENFEFSDVSQIVQADPALAISLLKMVNAQHHGTIGKIKTISHAVAMLGQKEVRKWVTSAVSKKLGADRPNEITRISLVRAKFAENLAPLYKMADMSQMIFCMGLFSVLDIILDVPMSEAMEMVHVADLIREPLEAKTGLFYPVLNMLIDYEHAWWSSVSRQMILNDISERDLADAYIDALIWYKNLIRLDNANPGNFPENAPAPSK